MSNLSNNKINVLYVSTLCSERMISDMFKNHTVKVNLAAQKFHRLIVQGMSFNRDMFEVNVLSLPPHQKNINKSKFTLQNETECGVLYTYIQVESNQFINRLGVLFHLTKSITKWILNSKNKPNIIFFDILNLSTSIVSLFVSKVFGVKTVAIVTDLPSCMYVLKNKISFRNKITIKFQNILLNKADGYVLLTEAMNQNLNKKNKPYCIIEGLSDFRILSERTQYKSYFESNIKVIHYSGGLYQKFGIISLIEAFMLIKNEDLRLHLFGNGDLNEFIKDCVNKDSRIVFFGYRDNREVLTDQLKATLLVNPRFTHEDYTKYSFPSKTIEYMASGVPLLTTKLPGIPDEYFKFVYTFKDEDTIGYKKSIEFVLNIPDKELKQFGKFAQTFVLDNKNNKIQAQKIYNTFYNSL